MSSRSAWKPSLSAESPTLRERIVVLRHIPPFVKLVWQTHRGLTIAMIMLRLARAFVPVAVLWIGKLIIDAVVAARGGSFDSKYLWQLVGLEIALAFLGEVLARLSAVVESLLGDLFSNRTSIMLMQHAALLDLYQFEDPAFYDQLDRARRQTTGRIGLLAQLLSMSQDALTLASLGAVLLFIVRGCYCFWLLQSFRGFWVKPTTRRLSTRCCFGVRPSAASSTICVISVLVIVRRKKCNCLDSRRGWLNVIKSFRQGSTKRISS
ncbi:MAG: hypothetical protein ACR2H6_12125 [Pyrinomonadaceae bacterium]